jgi:hypothetical protein
MGQPEELVKLGVDPALADSISLRTSPYITGNLYTGRFPGPTEVMLMQMVDGGDLADLTPEVRATRIEFLRRSALVLGLKLVPGEGPDGQ